MKNNVREPKNGIEKKAHLPPKNRVGGFSEISYSRTRSNWSKPQYSRPENDPTPTTIASGVLYYGYRYYNPEMGRWINRDPLGDRVFLIKQLEGKRYKQRKKLQSAAKKPVYLLLSNNPTTFWDLLGLACATISGCSQDQLDNLRAIPENWKPGDPEISAPKNGKNCDLDGLWVKGQKDWLGLPNHCEMTIQCNADGSISHSCQCQKLKTALCKCYNYVAKKAGGKQKKCGCGFYPDSGDYEHSTDYPW